MIDRGVVNPNHAPVAADATIMNGRNRPETVSFTLTTATGGQVAGFYDFETSPGSGGEVQPGQTAEWQVLFAPLRSDGAPTRVTAEDSEGKVVAQVAV